MGSVGEDGVDGLLDTADTGSTDDLQLHVSLISPGGTPRVSHDPVADATGGSVSDHTDGVIEVGSARGGVEDSTSVGLEGGSVGLDEDGDGLLVEGGLDGVNVLGGGHLVAGGLDAGSSVVVSARSVFTGVGVGVFGHGVSTLVVIEGFVLPSSTASMVLLGAINELLLGEREERSGLDEVSSFHGHVGGEGPARSA